MAYCAISSVETLRTPGVFYNYRTNTNLPDPHLTHCSRCAVKNISRFAFRLHQNDHKYLFILRTCFEPSARFKSDIKEGISIESERNPGEALGGGGRLFPIHRSRDVRFQLRVGPSTAHSSTHTIDVGPPQPPKS